MEHADYAILGHPSTKTFVEMFRQAKHYRIPTVKVQWVFECEKENDIIDPAEYMHDDARVVRKRGRPSSTGQRYVLENAPADSATNSSSEDKDEDEEPARLTPPKKKKQETAVKKEKAKKAKVEKKKEPEEEPFVNTTPKGEKKGMQMLFCRILLNLMKS